MKPISYALLLSAVISVTGCKKNDTPNTGNTQAPPPQHGVNIYVSGTVTAKNSVTVATYWKNGKTIPLADSSTNSYAYSLAQNDTDIYIAGYANNTPTYWKNGTPVALPGGGVAIGIAVSGSDVYAAGFSPGNATDYAAYWKNGAVTRLTGDTVEASATSIAVSGSDVYVAGYTQKAGAQTICYWKNGIIHNLSTNAVGNYGSAVLGDITIAVSGSDVYVTDAVEDISGIHIVATYWKNGTEVPLATDGSIISSGATNIMLSGSSVYITGFDDDVATYWLNGAAVKLTNNQQQYTATAITVNGGNTYVAGVAGGYVQPRAVYWKNGTLVTLSTAFAITNGIAVVAY